MKTHPSFDLALQKMRREPMDWLVTGAAGFIGSHLVEELLLHGQRVVGLDNFSNGNRENLTEIERNVGTAWKNFKFFQGDICDFDLCLKACQKVQVVLHQAALGSVPRSLANPVKTNESNVTGFLNVLFAAKESKVRRLVFASSSSVYGDNTDLPKVEEKIGRPLSPYAVTKVTNELYASTFSSNYGMEIIGLRYFNVFGPRQLADNPYAAVIPKWILAMNRGTPVEIFGDGSTSRDFCYVKNAIQMNLLAATTENKKALGRVFNTACQRKTSLMEVYSQLVTQLLTKNPNLKIPEKIHLPNRKGDIQHSLAEISAAKKELGYQPLYFFEEGLSETVEWFHTKT